MVTHSNPSYYRLMNQEIELKLRLNPSELPLLEQVLTSKQYIAEPTLQLLNRYFDTPTMALSQGGAALRIRQVALDLDIIKNSHAQDHLSAELDLTTIGALFTTDFQRKQWLYKQGDTVIEMVLDQGSVSTEEQRIDLLELELELKSGDAEILFTVAQNLAQQCPVLMSDISKAERGYNLLARSKTYQGIKKDWQDQVPVFDPQQDVISTFKAYFSYQLSA